MEGNAGLQWTSANTYLSTTAETMGKSTCSLAVLTTPQQQSLLSGVSSNSAQLWYLLPGESGGSVPTMSPLQGHR